MQFSLNSDCLSPLAPLPDGFSVVGSRGMAMTSESWAQISAHAGIVAAQLRELEKVSSPNVGSGAIFPRCGGTSSSYTGQLAHDHAIALMMDSRPDNSCAFDRILRHSPFAEVHVRKSRSDSVYPGSSWGGRSAQSMNHEVLPYAIPVQPKLHVQPHPPHNQLSALPAAPRLASGQI